MNRFFHREFALRVLGRIKINSNKIPFYSKRKIFNSTFSRIHNESTLFRKFSINSLPVFPIHHAYSIFFANLLWFRFLFCEFAMDSLFNRRIHFEYLIFFCFANLVYIKKVFRENDLNPLSYSRISGKSTICFANLLCISYFSRDSPWIHYYFREFTINSLSFWRIHHLFRGLNLNWLTSWRENL